MTCRRRRSEKYCGGNSATRPERLIHWAADKTALFGGSHDGNGNRRVIWTKTDAGRVEMQARAIIKERARRNLLLLIDGLKSEEMLLTNLAGITANDFIELQKLALIEPATGGVSLGDPSRPGGPRSAPAPAAEAVALDYGQFTAALTKLISAHLGLRGFVLTLAVEKAGTIEELRDVAQRAIELIRERKGDATASEARKTLYGA
jgi:hypothetical protein